MRYKEGNIIYKKDLLKSLIRDKKVRSCTIVGAPTQELIDSYLDENNNLDDLYSKYGLTNNSNVSSIYDTTISTYIPNWDNKDVTDICSITIKNPTEEIIDNIESLFVFIEEYYQVDVPPSMICRMIGMFSESIAFSDILYLLPIGRQGDLAELIGKSKQLISDMKTGKSKITIDVLRVLMREFPLLPWEYFIKGQC